MALMSRGLMDCQAKHVTSLVARSSGEIGQDDASLLTRSSGELYVVWWDYPCLSRFVAGGVGAHGPSKETVSIA